MCFNKIKFKKRYARVTIVFMTLFLIHASVPDADHGLMYPENLNIIGDINRSRLYRNVTSPSNSNDNYGLIYKKKTENKSCYELISNQTF